MTDIQMHRNNFNPPRKKCQHAGLFLLKGFEKWDLGNDTDQGQSTGGNHNKDIGEHHKNAAEIKVPDHYKQAYDRWKAHLVEYDDNCGHWFGELTGRLYLGLGEPSPLEAGIALHHTYGVPYIPGSAVKGVLHHCAIATGMEEADMTIIFGEEPDPKNKKAGDAGYVIFNDAWWIPESGNPLAPEVVTVHHSNYYKTGGKDPATDFDDPNPNPQIAIRGSFHFSYLAHERLHDVVQRLLEEVLQHYGIGGKTSSGYGLFVEDESNKNAFDTYKAKQEENRKKKKMSPLELDIYEIEKNFNNPAVDLLKALEKNRWPDRHDQDIVARRIQAIMQAEGKWKPNFGGTNKEKLRLKERCLKVMGYFLSEDKESK